LAPRSMTLDALELLAVSQFFSEFRRFGICEAITAKRSRSSKNVAYEATHSVALMATAGVVYRPQQCCSRP